MSVDSTFRPAAAAQQRELEQLDFDPYASWFNIHSPEWPVNPYLLLGVPEFERSVAKIEAGFARRQKTLQSYREHHEALWRLLTDEIAAAIETLRDREQRAVLDASLRRKAAATQMTGGAARAASGATITCPCGTVNAAQRLFCSQCGSGIWRICCSCNVECAIDEVHCGSCGANIDEAEQRMQQECESKLAAARKLAQEHRYDQALLALRRILLLEDPRLDPLIQKAAQLKAEVTEHRERSEAAVERLYVEGKQRLDGHDLTGALQVLQRIPEPLRKADHERALKEAAGRHQTCQKQEALIRELIAEKRYQELAAPIDRLLSVKPNHDQAVKLAGQVRDQLCAVAKKKLSEHAYDAASELLDAVPTMAVDDRVRTLRESVRERRGLLRHLAVATVVSGNHVAIAKKLVQLTDSDDARAMLEQAEEAWTQGRKMPLAPWRQPPQRTAIGCPVDWKLYPRVQVDESCRREFASQPSRLFGVTGLALQAVGLALRSINFAPQESKGRFGSLLKRKQEVRSAWGVDIGSQSVKAVRLSKDGEQVKLDRVVVARRSPESSEHELRDILSRMKSEQGWAGEALAVSFSSQYVNIRTAPLPPLDPKKLDAAIKAEAEAMFPMDIADIRWRCDVRQLSDDRRFGSFVAVKQSIIERALTPWKELDLAPTVVTVDGLASRNGWACGAKPSSQALLDIGDSAAVFSLEDAGRLWVRTLPFGGEQVTGAIVKRLRVTREEAERIKLDYSQSENLHELFDALQPVLQNMHQEVARSLEAISAQHSDVTCDGLTCVGGTSLLTGLIDMLRLGK